MFGYIYKTTIVNENSCLHNHFYIGQKQSNKIIENYYGSGKKLRDYFTKHCIRKWSRRIYPDEVRLLGLSREILDYAENIEELNQLEAYYVNQELDNPLCMNLMTGGYGRIVKKEVTQAMAENKRNQKRKWWTNGTIRKYCAEKPGDDFRLGRDLDGYSWYNNGIHSVYTKECPEGFIKGTLPVAIRRTPWNKGLKLNNYIKKGTNQKIKPWNKGLTKETSQKVKEIFDKVSVKNKGKHFSPNTEWKKGHKNWNTGLAGKGICKPNSGSFNGDEYRDTKRYNNGIKNIRVKRKPEGDEWVEGMLPYKRKKIIK